MVRFTANGSPDPDFDGDGKVLTPFPGGRGMAVKVAIQPGDGKIVVAGEFRAGTSGADGDVAVARYNADRSLDAGFDGDGLVTTSAFPTGPERARDVAIQSDGKIVAVGFGTQVSDDSEDPEEPLDDALVLRYNPDGSLDGGFDGEGGSKDRGNGGSGRNLCFTVERIDSGSCVKSEGKAPKRPRFIGPSVCNFPQCGF